MSRQLDEVTVNKISLVKKAANGTEVTVFKSADYAEETPVTPEVNPVENAADTSPEATQAEAIEKSAEGPEKEETLTLLKKCAAALQSVFAPAKPAAVTKSADISNNIDYTSFSARLKSPRKNITDAMYLLEDVTYSIFWDETVEDGKGLILKNIDEFKAYVEGVLNSPDTEVKKSFFAKANKEEDEDMKAEEIQKMLEPITKSMEGISGRIEALEKGAEKVPEVAATATAAVEKSAEVEAKTQEVAKSAEDASVILAEIKKSVDGLGERLTLIENVRGLSSQTQPVAPIAKSAEEDPWGGILAGL